MRETVKTCDICGDFETTKQTNKPEVEPSVLVYCHTRSWGHIDGDDICPNCWDKAIKYLVKDKEKW